MNMRLTIVGVGLLISFFGYGQQNDSEFVPAEMIYKDKDLEKEARAFHLSSTKGLKGYSSVQLKYMRETYYERYRAFVSMIHDGKLIMEGELYDYVQSVVDKVVTGANLSSERKVFLVRKESPNAFNMGDDRIFIHLGLLYRLNNEEELAFVIAHELGHNELEHFTLKVTEYAELLDNDSIQKKRKSIVKSRYGRVTALNKLMIPWILSNKELSRTCEDQADLFGYDNLLKSNYNPFKAKSIFDILEKGEHECDTLLLKLRDLLYLDDNKLDYSKSLDAKIESSLGSFTVEKDTLDDLLRTHPFSKDRKKLFLKRLEDENAMLTELETDSNYIFWRNIAEHEMIVNAIFCGNIDRAILYALQLSKRDSSNYLVQKIIPFCFAYLGYEKEKRRAGKIVRTQSPNYDDVYNNLIHFLRALKPEQCYEIANNWNKRFNGAEKMDESNASKVILDLKNKKYEDFKLRFDREKEKEGNYYILKILDPIYIENSYKL